MEKVLVFALIVYAISPAFFAAWLAIEKNRSPLAWFVLGLLFNLFALIAIAGAPYNVEEPVP